MFDLARHIEILLLSNDCVIVPDLGGFVAHHIEATYDEEEGVFLPPQRTLGFNPQLKINDSLLAQSYTEAYDISYPEAVRRIDEEVTELRQHLENEGFVELNGIGVLETNEEGNLRFSPCEAGILTPTLYGLGAVNILPLQSAAAQVDNQEDDGHSAKIVRMSWVRNAVAVAAAIIMFFLLSTPVDNTPLSNMKLGSVDFPIIPTDTKFTVRSIEADVVKKAILHKDSTAALQTTSHDSLKVAKVVAETKPQPTAKQPRQSYGIVMASHISLKNAQNYVALLHHDGYPLARVYVHNHINRVVYGDYDSEAEAQSELRVIRGNKHFEEAWVTKLYN